MHTPVRLVWVALLLAIGALAHAETMQGTVVGIIDGDTVDVLDEKLQTWRIRLAGIAAPEKRQPFGHASRQHLASLVFQKAVQVDWKKRDRYERIVGTIVIDGADANLPQVAESTAWVYRQYLGESDETDRWATCNLLMIDSSHGANPIS